MEPRIVVDHDEEEADEVGAYSMALAAAGMSLASDDVDHMD